jgi:rhamnose utilization protein RhaD (predicted bifunctional aldolase and dehydrogenase)
MRWNTSVKSTVLDLFGERQDILYVKGSGWVGDD